MIFQRVSSLSFSLVLYEFRARQEIQYFIFFILLSVKFNYKMLLFGGSHDAVMLFFSRRLFFHLLLLLLILPGLLSILYLVILHFSHECRVFDGYQSFKYFTSSHYRMRIFSSLLKDFVVDVK